jgi:hypothetical protein
MDVESVRVLRNSPVNAWTADGRNAHLNNIYMALTAAKRKGDHDDEKFRIYQETLLGPASTDEYRALTRDLLASKFSGGLKYTKRKSLRRKRRFTKRRSLKRR